MPETHTGVGAGPAAVSSRSTATARCTPAHRAQAAVLAALFAVAASSAMLEGCTTVVRVPAPAPRVVVREMPAPVVEEVPAQPGPQFHWRQGHWVWHDNGGWRWQRGEWVATEVRPMPPVIVEQITVAPSPQHVWVRGHWVWHGNEWVWARGHWVLG